MNSNNKTLTKNTVYMYLRMIVIMAVTLYTTRVVLSQLGEVDYGIYNVVGGVAISLVFIQNSLLSATQRFLSYELGKKVKNNVSRIFSMSLNLHVIFAIVAILILETLGLWFVNNVLNIPYNKIDSANVAYHFSVLTYIVTLLRIPYNALIISNEKMHYYAIFSIFEALLRLGIALMLTISSFDKLELYTFLLFISALLINIIYWIACKCNFKDQCIYKFENDGNLFKQLSSFLGWNLVGGVIGMVVVEGPSYFINYFYGVTLNAAIGVAKQLNAAVYSFSSNFQSAFNPQIIKTYASGSLDEFQRILKTTSVISYLLLFIIALPFVLCCQTILNIWLVDVPEYTNQFAIFLILSQLLGALGAPLWMAAHAIGNIGKYQRMLSYLNLLIIPMTWIILKVGMLPYWVYVALILINLLVYLYRIEYLSKAIGFNKKDYYKEIYHRCIIPSIVSVPFPFFVSIYAPDTIYGVLYISLTSIASIGVSFWILGLNKSIRYKIVTFVRNAIINNDK